MRYRPSQMQVEALTRRHDAGYDAMVRRLPTALVFATSGYRRYLQELLPRAKPRYIIALDGGDVVGALPAFECPHARGAVLNSLPYFGSNGGALVAADYPDRPNVERCLVDAWREMLSERAVIAGTLVSNAIDGSEARYESLGAPLDERIGQILRLPVLRGGDAELDAALLAWLPYDARRMVTKARREGVTVEHDGGPDAVASLYEMHRANIAAIGGTPKSRESFDALRRVFTYDTDYRIFRARWKGTVIAALLVFYTPSAIDYFTPATDAAHRALQPASLLVLHAMLEGVRRGCRLWNWGGTWTTQPGVYAYKAKWGGEDLRYHYYVTEKPGSVLRSLTPSEIAAAYPGFYAIPFRFAKPEAT